MHFTATRLREIIARKQTNLCVSADLTTCAAVLELARQVGDQICLLKTHVDILTDFTPDFPNQLRAIAEQHDFLIFEDRKFADIGNTVALQFGSGVYQIAAWADFVNAHTIVGPGIIEGLAQANQRSGLILLAQMTPRGNLFTPEYAKQTVALAQQYPDFVVGFIGSSDRPEVLRSLRELAGTDLLILTPGIQLAAGGDALGQSYNTPERAIGNGADVIIVGRGIYEAADQARAAAEYRLAGWSALERRA